MNIDHKKMRGLLTRDTGSAAPDELRREENVFFIGGNLPERQTLETLFDSHFQSHAALFHLTFGSIESFENAENLARVIKKNFNAHLVGRLDFAAPAQLIARAYAAGVDIVDIPLTSRDGEDRDVDRKERLRALETARGVFPRWSVVSTLLAGDSPAATTMAEVDLLVSSEVLPLVSLSSKAVELANEEISGIFTHLDHAWQSKKAAIKPLLPLIYLFTPFIPTASRGVVRGLIDIIEDRRLLATSDLRRLLRVKEVEESFASSGL